MTYIFCIFAAVLIWFSVKSFLGGIAYLRYFRAELSAVRPDWQPFATIIAPCKGLDDGLEQNLTALIELDYPEYEVIFVVDDPEDPAVKVIQAVSQTGEGYRKKTALTVAPKATDSSQKVENLREGVIHADPRSEVFVFVDSDARPSPAWLRALVAPLRDETIGATTGYRWFISEDPSLASEIRSSWNASIASALGPNARSNFCWGGSMAIRRDTFERLNIRDRWHGSLSDDFTVTRAMNAGDLPIRFVPEALAASVENCTIGQLFEFTNRQMKITRVYMPKLWLMSFFGSALFNSVLITAFLIVIFSRANTALVWAAIFTLITVSGFSVGKAWTRLRAVRLVLSQHARALDRQWLTQNTLWLITPAVFLVNCFSALSRRMRWRGTEYEMASPEVTKIIEPG
ncbi:MAG TPA: glycosyltransferase family 2 protein [Pyrinomonadaceae bacterium]|nr:glycosyltransferase family 2 protein [Chloracidobacterium sp.]HBE82151.1 hypothetical protein [Blastocatellia bacterium]HRJ87271.1 glycosyltransferase family 2 protein [Pyrinomonadaceae bacterium]HRK50891.1 glycosyltransferase family 2 protein [Pyrinomonadaceae bacterium]